MNVLGIASTVLVLSIILTYIVRRFARNFGIVAIPSTDRWHSKPTALLGGVAVFASYLIAMLCLSGNTISVKRLLLGGALLFVVGLFDDLFQIGPYVKLGVQLVAASALIFTGVHLPWTQVVFIDIVITFVWLVGITNAVNMLDNMDGLAAGISIISCLCLAFTFFLNKQYELVLIPIILASAITGFLIFNFNPASIFMGDCGSLFIGFTIAGISLYSIQQRTRNIGAVLATPVLIMLLPIFDTTIVTISRRLNGLPVMKGGKDHTSHRLVMLGMSDRKAVLSLYLISVLSGLLALLVRNFDLLVSITLIASFILFIIFFGIYLGKVVVYDRGVQIDSFSERNRTSFIYRRRLLEITADFTVIALAYYVAYLLRFDGSVPLEQQTIYLRTLPYVLAVHLCSFLFAGIYKGSWSLKRLDEIVKIIKTMIISTILSVVLVFMVYSFSGPSRSVFIIAFAIGILGVVCTRISLRLFSIIFENNPSNRPIRSVYVYGANELGVAIASEVEATKSRGYIFCGFIDDEEVNIRTSLNGYHIYKLSELLAQLQSNDRYEIMYMSTGSNVEAIQDLKSKGLKVRSVKIEF